MGIEIEYPLRCASSGDTLFCDTGMPRDRRVFRAYMDDEHDPKILLTWAETDSFSVTVIPRIFIEAAALIWFEMGES